MTLPDLTPPRSDPPMLPWWPWLLYMLMAAGIVVALGVYARQGWHIAENKAAAEDISVIVDEVITIKAEVSELRQKADRLESGYYANRNRIRAVETEADDDPAKEPKSP